MLLALTRQQTYTTKLVNRTPGPKNEIKIVCKFPSLIPFLCKQPYNQAYK